jgi:hypothetical protein
VENLHQNIEALIFSSETAVSKEDIVVCIQKLYPESIIEEELIEQHLQDILQKYKADYFSFELRVIGGGYQFFTKAGLSQNSVYPHRTKREKTFINGSVGNPINNRLQRPNYQERVRSGTWCELRLFGAEIAREGVD